MAGTPFIPPLNTPEGSPISSPPVIPGSGGSPNMPPGQGWGIPVGYPMFSPYQNPSPFIPSSPFVAPGVIPGQKQSQTHAQSQTHTRPGLSADWTGYPQGTPFTSPPQPLPGGQPYQSPHHPPHHLTSPWYPPAGYPAFGGTPWPAPAQPFPPNSTPWGMQRNLPPQAQAYTPWAPPGAMPPQPGNWGPQPFFHPQDPWNPPVNPQPLAGPRGPPEPPSQIFDRLDPFMDGDSYGPVLDSKILHITGAHVRINPLLAPLPDDGPDEVHLKWNMLFPTSTIQRSIDPSHVSWSKGRDSPATFPRLKELRIVSEIIPWIIHVKASKEDIGVTCAEVIEAIARDLYRNTGKADFEALPPQMRNEVRAAYKHNRSPLPNVPGGMLGQGLKRLDFLRKNSIFGGIEFKERIIRKVFSDKMPGVFVLKCRQNMMTKTEIEDQHRRLASEREHSRTPSSNGRRRANSTTISVESPTEASTDMGD